MHNKIKELQRRANPINYTGLSVDEFGSLMEDERKIGGYLIAWGVRDSYGTVFVKGCCAKSLQERGVGSPSNYKITMLWQHDQKDPIGRFTLLEEDNYGLRFEAILDSGVENADRALNQIKSGTINQFSVGFNYVWDKVEYRENEDELILKEIILMEGSVVTIGANEGTYAFRNKDEYENRVDAHKANVELFIKSLPSGKQLEARQLFTEANSLTEPLPALKEPGIDGIDYNYLLNNLKIN